MKKSVLLFTIAGLFLLLLISNNVFAYPTCSDAHPFVPCTLYGVDYTQYILTNQSVNYPDAYNVALYSASGHPYTFPAANGPAYCTNGGYYIWGGTLTHIQWYTGCDSSYNNCTRESTSGNIGFRCSVFNSEAIHNYPWSSGNTVLSANPTDMSQGYSPSCTSWVYSDWGDCQSNGMQTRTVISSSPNGCSGGSPVLTQSCAYEPQLTIVIDPSTGGTVALGSVTCNSCPCQYPLSQVNTASIQANANSGYAFGYWQQTANPHAVTPTADTTITAKFFKTFRNPLTATGGFGKEIGDTTGGQCVDYVKYETGITTASGQPFSGNAWTYYQEAIAAGYQTGIVPRPGAIIVYGKVPGTSLSVGHVGIVTDYNSANGTITVRESNWSTPGSCTSNCETVGTHTETLGDHEILGYIYPTP